MKNLEKITTPSALIRLAIDDLVSCSSDNRYRIDMYSWHEYKSGVCLVCLAGSVIAKTLEVDYKTSVNPSDLDLKLNLKLRALNMLRYGNIDNAMYCLGYPEEQRVIRQRAITRWVDSPKQFIKDMSVLADDFEKEGQ